MKIYLPVLLLLSVFFSTKSYTQNTIPSVSELNQNTTSPDKDAMNWQLSYDFMGIDMKASQATCTGDFIPPTIFCPQDIVFIQGTNTTDCGANINYSYPSATDNCPEAVSVQCSLPPLSFFSTGTTTVTCTATDASNNTANCMFNVVVLETVPPIIACPTDITTSTDPNNCNARVTWADPLVTDNCGVGSFTCTRSSGSYFSLGTSSVTCYGTDISNNTSSCTFSVTVVDTEPPVISCLNDITVVSDPDICSATVNWSTPSVTDNCGVNTITSDLSSGSTFPVGTTTVTYIATDIFGNLSTCMFDVTVIDNEPAIIMCPSDIVVSPDPNTCDAVVTWADPVSGDCGSLMTFCNIESGSTFPVGTTNVFCLVTGVSTTIACQFDVIVNDCLANCPPIITLNNTTANGLYHAQNSVTATNTSTSGATTNLKAGNCIELNNGFTAPASTDFSAEIEDCTPNFGQNGDQN